MTLPIIEAPLYGQIQFETAPWAATFTWTDRTADISGGFNYAEGGRVGPPGTSQVDVGTMNVTLKDAATIPAVGDAVRLRRYGTSEYFFTGYVQNVSQRIVFDQSVSLATPVTLTTVFCADWVGYISQFQAVGVGGYSSSYVKDTSSYYQALKRIYALNRTIDSVFINPILSAGWTDLGQPYIGDTDMVGTFADHLDLLTRSAYPSRWFGQHVLPTNITTGRQYLVRWENGTPTSSGYTFRDTALATAGNLHYTEIDFENSTQNVANTIVLKNRTRIEPVSSTANGGGDISRIGGFNQQNFMVIDGKNVVGIPVDTTQQKKDNTSITAYGIRQVEFETNVAVPPTSTWNVCANPSAEYSDDGFSGSADTAVRRQKPSLDPNPFTTYNGLWAIRSRRTSSGSSASQIIFTGGETNGTLVTSTVDYYFKAQALRGTISQSNLQAWVQIEWFNDAEVNISSSIGTKVNLTTANTWYQVSVGPVARPALAVRAQLRVVYQRSSGSQSAGDLVWADALYFGIGSSISSYYDGDYENDTSFIYGWTGGVGSSPSYRGSNNVDTVASSWLADYSTTSMRPTRIRWNAQEDLSAVSSLTVGKTISLVYDGTTTTHRIVGIDGNVDPERYMIDYYLIKV
jgi:hypothetical protein